VRGFPLLRLFLVAAGLVLLGVPVWLLTRPVPSSPPPASAAIEPEKMAVYEVLLTASAPARLAVRVANQSSVESAGPATSLTASFTMNAAEPEDLAVFGNFDPAAGNSALRVEVRLAGKTLADSTFWGTGLVEDVVTMPKP
jgi:hypothetical protein